MNKKIKIIHIMPVFATGGAEKLVLQYANLLDKDKYEIYVASCVEGGELWQKFSDISGVTVYLGSRTKDGGRLKTYWKLWKFIKEIKPDIMHTHLSGADIFGFFVKLFFGKKIIWISTKHNVGEKVSALVRIVWSSVLKFADKIIAVSSSVENYIVEKFGIKKNKIVTLLNGVDTIKWLQVSMDKLFTHKKIQLASIGRLWKQKGHTYLLQALPLLKGFDYELHLFGDGPLFESLQQEAHDLGVYEKIVWHGVTDNLIDYMSDIDIVVQPSLWEGLSLVVMEMMSAGRPIVATNPAGEELLISGKQGLLVEAESPTKLVEAIKYLVVNKKESISFAKEARKFAENNFDIKKNLSGLEKIYISLLDNKK